MASKATILLAVLATSICLASAQTTGVRFEGYTFVSDVQGYLNMTMDFCDIQAAIVAGNFTEAQNIYLTGKNSFSGAAKRTFYRFASHVPSVPEPLYDLLTIGRNGTWLHDMIISAFAAKDSLLAQGLIHVASLKYFVHEIDEGYNKIASYLTNTTALAIQISDDKGAPHNVDEAFSLWAGGMAPNCRTLATMTVDIGNDMDTTFVGPTYANMHMSLALNEFLASARKGDNATYAAHRANLVHVLSIVGMQGVLRGAYKATLAAKCRKANEEYEGKTEIKVHWTYLYPLLVSHKPSTTSASSWARSIANLGKALTVKDVRYSDVYNVAKEVIPGMGRRLSEVGVPNFATINTDWKCPTSAKP